MSNFKTKKNANSKKKGLNDITLEKKYKDKINNINKEKDKLPNVIKEIEKIENKLNKSGNKLSDDDRVKLLDKLDDLKEKKERLESDDDIMDYHDKAGDILIEYYKLNTQKKFLKAIDLKNFSKRQTTVNPKSELFEKYSQHIDGVRMKREDGKNRIKKCTECGIEKLIDYGASCYICPECGDSEEIIFNEEITDYSPYKRENRFKECINLFQAKQSPDIPESVFIEIKTEIEKENVMSKSDVNYELVRRVLKKISYNKLYDYIPYIITKITGIPAPKINQEIEKEFINMFRLIQEPWELYKQDNRKNFLPYSYVLHKFCLIKGLDNLLPSFRLLKSPRNLKDHERVWKNICKHLNWQFIPSL